MVLMLHNLQFIKIQVGRFRQIWEQRINILKPIDDENDMPNQPELKFYKFG